MKVAVFGLGYVGLTHVAYLSQFHDVMAIEPDERKRKILLEGGDYLHEPNVSDMLKKHAKKITYTTTPIERWTDIRAAILAVPTPNHPDGSADLSRVEAVVDELAIGLDKDAWIVVRSTVPPGTYAHLMHRLTLQNRTDLHIVMLPEFLVTGQAYQELVSPIRVVLGSLHEGTEAFLRSMFDYGIKIPFVVMHPDSACLTKYASNTFLATKVSWINHIAQLADVSNANIDDVIKALQYDPRLGGDYLKPGIGFGGGCLPKDVQAIASYAVQKGIRPTLLETTLLTNQVQPMYFLDHILTYFHHQLEGLKIAILGISFKGTSHEVTHSPALVILDALSKHQAHVIVYDPLAMPSLQKARGEAWSFHVAQDIKEALTHADVCLILSDLPSVKELKAIDFIRLMKKPLVFDGRNVFPLAMMKGVEYYSIGRPAVKP
jgi:UDPglucose 6-dehydrogenase